ncbi:MAG: GDP-L-fucose synthase [Patescibacteria group bacterium]
MPKNAKIYIAGHTGLAGSTITRALTTQGYKNLILRTHKELDLLDQKSVADFFKKEKPEYVFLAAAKVGGIMANIESPAQFIYENLEIQNNVIHQSYLNKVKKLLFLGSSCVYPRLCPQPMKEEYLLTGLLEPTNEGYALAKIAGIKMCEMYNRQYDTNFIAIMPPNLYGENDHFDLNSSHVLQSLLRKFHEAKIQKHDKVELWGTGQARREFLHTDDMANAAVFVMNNFDPSKEQNEKGEMFLNVGSESDCSIAELAELIKGVVGFSGNITWDKSKPDGMPQKLLDAGKIHRLGWHHKIELEDGLLTTYKSFKEEYKV